MRASTRVFLETVAKKRMEAIREGSPDLGAEMAMDDSGLRCAIQVTRDGELVRLEFIESPVTAGKQAQFDDYIEVAKSVGSLAIIFPESKFSRDMASNIYQSVLKEARQRTDREISFLGFVYDERMNLKKVE
ncbi:MAG TPA: hypothetical protein PLR51_04610 [Methanomassiliicoccales archaeon]|nr:hypothetical protein [Methanomassiliicoccales archaeon]HQQ25545.1 hypothetical protein [Methanomassiliicoccales archaeon]